MGGGDLRFSFNGFELGDIIAWNVSLLPGPFAAGEPPVALSVIEDLKVLALAEAEILVGPGIVVIKGDKNFCSRRVSLRDLRHRSDRVGRRGRHRAHLWHHSLYVWISYPLRFFFLRVRGTAETLAHSCCFFFLSIYNHVGFLGFRHVYKNILLLLLFVYSLYSLVSI